MADNAALFAQFEKMMMKKLAAQHKRTDAALAANQSQLASQASTIASLTNKVGSLEKQLATTKFELATTKSELEDTLSSTQDYVDGFRDYVEERSDRLDDVQEQVSASHDTLVIVQNSLHQADLRADAHESTLGQIAKRLDPFGQWRHLTRTGLGAVGKVWTWYVHGSPVAQPAAARPAGRFPHLPVELVDMVADLSDKEDGFNLAQVQRSWFKMIAKKDQLWSRGTLTEDNIAAFLAAKASLSKKSHKEHLSSLFETEALSLVRHRETDDFLPEGCPILRDLIARKVTIRVLNLHLVLTTRLGADLTYFSEHLRAFNPTSFSIWGAESTLPTLVRFNGPGAAFPTTWTKLKTTAYFGTKTIACLDEQGRFFSPPGRIPTSHNFVRRWAAEDAFSDGLVDPMVDPVAPDQREASFTLTNLEVHLSLVAFTGSETHVGLETTWGPRP